MFMFSDLNTTEQQSALATDRILVYAGLPTFLLVVLVGVALFHLIRSVHLLKVQQTGTNTQQ